MFLPLHTVAKRKSLFDDKAVEIEELTYIIKQVKDQCNVSFYTHKMVHIGYMYYFGCEGTKAGSINMMWLI